MPTEPQVEQVVYKNQAQDRIDAPSYYSTPAHLQAVAYLHGLTAPAPDNARILEIGCGRGRGLQLFALTHPTAEIIGIDLHSDVLEQGLDETLALGIGNIQFRHTEPSLIDATFGVFDYIIVRDQYTWASQSQRQAILQICKRHLASNGIAYVGFHTLPGSHVLDTLRDAIQLHGSAETTLKGILPYAEAILQGLASSTAMQPGAQDIREAAARILLDLEYYVHADLLQRPNNANYLIEVITAAMAEDLAYLSDALPETGGASNYGTATHLQTSLLALGKGPEVRQQYLDFANNRKFSQAVLVHPQFSTLASKQDLKQRLVKMHFACGLQRKHAPTTRAEAGVIFRNTAGEEFTLTDGLEIAVCDTLATSWPQSIPFTELLDTSTLSRLPNKSSEDRSKALYDALYSLIGTGQLRYRLMSGPYNLDFDSEAKLSLIVSDEYISSQGEKSKVLWNLWGDSQSVGLGQSPESFKKILDKLNGPFASELAANNDVVELIEQLRWHGLLVGSDAAWFDYYSALLRADCEDDTYKLHLLPKYIAHYCNVRKSRNHIGNSRSSLPESPELKNKILKMQKLHYLDDYDGLRQAADDFILTAPENWNGWYFLALTEQAEGDQEKARESLWKAISIDPGGLRLYITLSNCMSKLSKTAMPDLLLRSVLRIDPQCTTAYINLGVSWWAFNQKELSIECYSKALELEPDNLAAQQNLAGAYGGLGDLERSIDLYEKYINKNPRDYATYSSYLYTLSLSKEISQDALFESHKKFGRQVLKDVKKAGIKYIHNKSDRQNKKIRLGFVSGDLYNHAVFSFINPIWRNIDKNRFEIYVYNTGNVEDNETRLLREYADHWGQIASLSYQKLADRIYQDGIDILFDLSGHTGFNRLPTFAYKPAPIQITWIGYPGTTGLSAMDYIIINEWAIPTGMKKIENQFTEKFIRLPMTGSFHMDLGMYKTNPLPFIKNGYFTFGSFNRLNKLSDMVFETWAKILLAKPTAKLLLGHIDQDSYQPIVNKFKELGINKDRLILKSRVNIDSYLNFHHEVDLLLDAFPYNGGTTTFYGLYMGVPTLTLAGNTLRSRSGVAILGPLEIDQLVAETVDEYVSYAINWTDKKDTLSEIRANLRSMFREDSLYGEKSVTKDFEKALEQIWKKWMVGDDLGDIGVSYRARALQGFCK